MMNPFTYLSSFCITGHYTVDTQVHLHLCTVFLMFLLYVFMSKVIFFLSNFKQNWICQQSLVKLFSIKCPENVFSGYCI
jgi:hypothetical protein